MLVIIGFIARMIALVAAQSSWASGHLHEAKNFVAPPFRMMYEGEQSGEPVDPLPGYVPPRESAETNPSQAKLYPLNIISPKSHGFLNSCYANEPHKIKGQGERSSW